MKHKRTFLGTFLLFVIIVVSSLGQWYFQEDPGGKEAWTKGKGGVDLPANPGSLLPGGWYGELPEYAGEASVPVNQGIPFFTQEELTREPFENYGELDGLGRCTGAYANVCREIMPTGERGNISRVKPTGWQTASYDIISDKHLYNRCHLIGYQLSGENANEKNLITGTRYMNVEGMLPWENVVAEYVDETENHVLYRVTPYFEGENLVASGVLMEGYSVEDEGAGVCFNVYCYNVQPGIMIDYKTGDNWLDESKKPAGEGQNSQDQKAGYVINTNTEKFHLPSCLSAREMNGKNREYFTGEREELIERGYLPCSRCNT